MKRFFTIILWLALLAIWPQIPYAGGAQNDAQLLFDSKCAICHTKNGEGNAGLASMVGNDMSRLNLIDKTTTQKTDGDLKNTIAKGVGAMPPFQNSLSEKEIDSLVKYIRALQKKS